MGVDPTVESQYSKEIPNPPLANSVRTPSPFRATFALALLLVALRGPLTATDPPSAPAPVISSPPAGASVNLPSGSLMTFTGSATDRSGVASVKVQLNDGEYQAASLTAPGATRTNWSITLEPLTGTNTVNVVTTNSISGVSPVVSRSFKVLRPLVVSVDTAQGRVTGGFAPASYREVGRSYTITATGNTTPDPGYLFDRWEINTSADQIGLTDQQLLRPTVTFAHQEGLELTPRFTPNPYRTLAGTYRGLIEGDSSSTPVKHVDGWGVLSVTVQSRGAFSAKLNLTGQTYQLAGAFDAGGYASVGTTRTIDPIILKRPGKTSISIFLNMRDLAGVSYIDCVLIFNDGPNTTVSGAVAHHLVFNGVTKLPPAVYLGPRNTNAAYTALLAVGSTGLPQEETPRGTGYGSMTVTKKGTVTFAGVMSDGTPLVMSSAISEVMTCPLYCPLYGNKGFFAVNPTLDQWSLGGDFLGFGVWSRPPVPTSHYYPKGWSEGLETAFNATQYVVTPGQSVLPGFSDPALEPPKPTGNAMVIFDPLYQSLGIAVNVNSRDGVALNAANATNNIFYDYRGFSLRIFRNTGHFSGTFIDPNNGKLTPYQGIIYQKYGGTPCGGFGFYLTAPPKAKTYDGKSGTVNLIPWPL